MKIISIGIIFLFSTCLWAYDYSPNLKLVVEKIDPTAKQLWDVTMGRVAMNELPLDMLDLHWDFKGDLNLRNSLREISFNFGLNDNEEFIIENLSIGQKSQSAVIFTPHQIKKWQGQFHNHPYKYDSLRDNCFSTTDVIGALERAQKTGHEFIWMVDTGDYYFALVVEDQLKIKAYWEQMTIKANSVGYQYVRDYLSKLYHSSSVGDGSVYAITTNGVLAVAGLAEKNGLGFYVTKKSKIEFSKLN